MKLNVTTIDFSFEKWLLFALFTTKGCGLFKSFGLLCAVSHVHFLMLVEYFGPHLERVAPPFIHLWIGLCSCPEGTFWREPHLFKPSHMHAQSPLGLRTGHVNLITGPRAVWDTWGYRIRPTARRGAAAPWN